MQRYWGGVARIGLPFKHRKYACRQKSKPSGMKYSTVPINIKRMRTLLVSKGMTKFQLKKLLEGYEKTLRQEINPINAKYKVIFVWVYDDLYRANAGLGEWIGMISNSIETGSKLSENPKISLRLKDSRIASPTERENQIYDYLQKALWKDPNIPEEEVLQKVANKLNMTPEELKRIYAKVFEYRNY